MNPTNDQKIACIKNSIMLICDIITDMPSSTVFKELVEETEDWISQLTLIYFLGLLGTDKYLTKDAIVMSKITVVLHDQLNTFTPFAWTGLVISTFHLA